MKKYVRFSPFIGGMGGGQMYVRNKVLFLRIRGWKVDVFSSMTQNILIPELKDFQKNEILPVFPTYFFSLKKQNKIIRILLEKIKDDAYEEIIIESNSINGGTWAEAVAIQTEARHIAFPLGERFFIENEGMQKFLIFKHERRELVGITENSIYQIFSTFSPIKKELSYSLPAYCNNVEADIDNPYIHSIDKSKYDFIIGCLSRLTKPFVISALNDFCEFADFHKEKKILLLFMGDSTEDPSRVGTIKKIIKERTSNVELIITGYLYPIPIKLLEVCHAFFSSAGSAWVCARSGRPTITYDGNDLKPIGILGRTTQNTLFRSAEEPIVDFRELMDQIFFTKKYPILKPTYKNELPDFQSHLDFIEKAANEREYYNIAALHIEKKKEKILSIIGNKGYKVIEALKKVLKF